MRIRRCSIYSLILTNFDFVTRTTHWLDSHTHTHTQSHHVALTLCLISLEFVFSLFIRLWLYVCVCLLLHETCYWAKRRNCVPVDLSSSTVSHSLPMLCVPKNKCTSCPKKNEQNKKEEKLLPAPSCMCGWCLASVFCPFIGFFSCSSFRVIETINNRNKGERLVKQLNLCCNTYGELWTCTFSNDEVKKYI